MDAAALRASFPVFGSGVAYLNAGTCGPVPEASVEAAVRALRWCAEEGRSGAFYERLFAALGELRARYAALLGAAVEDVAITAGTSDGVGRVVAGLELGPGDEIVTADDEHPGLQGPLAAARTQRGVELRAVPLDRVPDAVGPRTRLVACSHVSWRSGRLAPLGGLAEVARLGVPVLLDGAQGVGAVPADVRELGVQFYAGSGQKWLCGPVGVGMLWVDPAWRDRVAVPAPHYASLADPNLGLESGPAPDARRFDAPSIDLATVEGAVASFDVLASFGWDEVFARGARLAARLAQMLAERGFGVVERDRTTLVAWSVGDDARAVELRDRLGAQGVVIRDLPGTGRLRASVGAWNDEGDLERLIEALG
jgi:L-cysteine/cystine lyase